MLHTFPLAGFLISFQWHSWNVWSTLCFDSVGFLSLLLLLGCSPWFPAVDLPAICSSVWRDPQHITHKRKKGRTSVGYSTSAEKGRNYICENNIVQKMLSLSDVSISKGRHKYIPQFFTSPMWPLSFGRLSVSKLHTCTGAHVHTQTHTYSIIASIWLMGFRSTDEWGTWFHPQLQVFCCLDVFLATALVWVSLQTLAHLWHIHQPLTC